MLLNIAVKYKTQNMSHCTEDMSELSFMSTLFFFQSNRGIYRRGVAPGSRISSQSHTTKM